MWWSFAANIAIAVVSALLYRPPAGPKPNVASDVSGPKAVEGARVIDFAGTRWIEDPHVIGSSDFDTKAIRGKASKK